MFPVSTSTSTEIRYSSSTSTKYSGPNPDYQHIMSGAGVRRSLVLIVTICPLYIINSKISPVFTHIYWIPEKIWVPWALSRPLWGPMWKMTKPVGIWGQTDFICFRIMKIGPVVFKICPRQIWFQWAFYLGPPGPIFSTPLKVVPMSIKKVSCESSGNLWQNRRKNNFWPILALLWVEKTPKYDPWGPIFYTLLKVVQVSLKK